MKKILFIALIFPITFYSCKKKGCMDELANNYSVDAKKDDGSCTYSWDQFLGTYSVTTGECDTPPGPHTSTITKGPTKNEMIIENFDNLGLKIRATISGNEFSYSELQGGVGYEGTGYIVDGVITINAFFCEDYNWPNECIDESCSYTFTPN